MVEKKMHIDRFNVIVSRTSKMAKDDRAMEMDAETPALCLGFPEAATC